MKKLTASLAVITALVFTACSKDNSEPSVGNIQGTWKITAMHAKTNSAIEYSGGGESIKSVTSSEYDTENNTGTVTIDNANWVWNGLGYSVNTTMHNVQYQNGHVEMEIDLPFNVSLSGVDGTTSYKMVGADSIYFPNGFFNIDGTQVNSKASGVRVKINGSAMIVTQTINSQESQLINGTPIVKTLSGNATITLQKQ